MFLEASLFAWKHTQNWKIYVKLGNIRIIVMFTSSFKCYQPNWLSLFPSIQRCFQVNSDFSQLIDVSGFIIVFPTEPLPSFIFSRYVEILGQPPSFVRIQLSHRHWLMCRYISGDLNKDATPSSSLRHPKSSCLLSRTVKQSVRDSLLGRWQPSLWNYFQFYKYRANFILTSCCCCWQR